LESRLQIRIDRTQRSSESRGKIVNKGDIGERKFDPYLS